MEKNVLSSHSSVILFLDKNVYEIFDAIVIFVIMNVFVATQNSVYMGIAL